MALTDNVKLDLYKAIKSALEGISSIKHVRHYNSQEVDFKSEKSRNFPQAYIGFSDITWKPSELQVTQSDTTQQQKGNITVTVYLELKSFKGDNESFEDDLDIINDVYREITMVEGDNWQPLQRVSEREDPSNDNVRFWAIDFITMVEETGVSQGLSSKVVTLEINESITSP